MVGTKFSSEVSSGGSNNLFTVIYNNDETEKPITAVKLNGANYLDWSKAFKVALRRRKG